MTIEKQLDGAIKFAGLQADSIRRESWRESISGPGSTVKNTKSALAWLEKQIADRGILSIADIPCGDHNWLANFNPIQNVEYIGLDALHDALSLARSKRPDRSFFAFNAIQQRPGRYDLILCRDFLVHLTFEHGLEVLENFRSSGSTYLAITTFPEIKVNEELQESHPGWGWRKLNMQLPPFNLGTPIDSVDEDEGQGKCLALFNL